MSREAPRAGDASRARAGFSAIATDTSYFASSPRLSKVPRTNGPFKPSIGQVHIRGPSDWLQQDGDDCELDQYMNPGHLSSPPAEQLPKQRPPPHHHAPAAPGVQMSESSPKSPRSSRKRQLQQQQWPVSPDRGVSGRGSPTRPDSRLDYLQGTPEAVDPSGLPSPAEETSAAAVKASSTPPLGERQQQQQQQHHHHHRHNHHRTSPRTSNYLNRDPNLTERNDNKNLELDHEPSSSAGPLEVGGRRKQDVKLGEPEDPNAPDEDEDDSAPNTSLVKQPESKPISQDQLAAEVKGIYAGLVLIENRCVTVVNAQKEALRKAQLPDASEELMRETAEQMNQWPALTALHRTLLHEHHDFFLASQHPFAAQPLRELASRYAMPARMWRHGIHAFLELLRQRLPHSLEFMVAFIYQAYQMMALLYETVRGFEEVWVECLGDLARYRMAVEEKDQQFRDVWTGVASYWYGKASDKSPKVGRLYHHLAILARTQALYQLSLYCRSLTAVIPFPSARESILTLLQPSLDRPMYNNLRQPSPDPWFIRYSALLFLKGNTAATKQALINFNTHLDVFLSGKEDWRKKGTYLAICLIGSLFLFGRPESALRSIFAGITSSEPSKDAAAADSSTAMHIDSTDSGSPRPALALVEAAKTEAVLAWQLTFSTFCLALDRPGEAKTLPHVVVMLTFFVCLASTEQGAGLLDQDFPWEKVANYLNVVSAASKLTNEDVQTEHLPTSDKDAPRILPEDHAMNGQVWCDNFWPADFFTKKPADEDERTIEFGWTERARRQRATWLGLRLTKVADAKKQIRKDKAQRWLCFDSMERVFYVDQA